MHRKKLFTAFLVTLFAFNTSTHTDFAITKNDALFLAAGALCTTGIILTYQLVRTNKNVTALQATVKDLQTEQASRIEQDKKSVQEAKAIKELYDKLKKLESALKLKADLDSTTKLQNEVQELARLNHQSSEKLKQDFAAFLKNRAEELSKMKKEFIGEFRLESFCAYDDKLRDRDAQQEKFIKKHNKAFSTLLEDVKKFMQQVEHLFAPPDQPAQPAAATPNSSIDSSNDSKSSAEIITTSSTAAAASIAPIASSSAKSTSDTSKSSE